MRKVANEGNPGLIRCIKEETIPGTNEKKVVVQWLSPNIVRSSEMLSFTGFKPDDPKLDEKLNGKPVDKSPEKIVAAIFGVTKDFEILSCLKADPNDITTWGDFPFVGTKKQCEEFVENNKPTAGERAPVPPIEKFEEETKEEIYAVDLKWKLHHHATDISKVMKAEDCRFIGTKKECQNFLKSKPKPASKPKSSKKK